MDTIGAKVVPLTDAGNVRRLGSTAVEQVMASGVSARVSGLLALGNQVTTNSSACSTGAEAIAIGWSGSARPGEAHAVRRRERRQPLHLGGLRRDARAVPLAQRHARARLAPMSASAGGFVAAAGAGLLLLESERARSSAARGSTPRCAGAGINCGGHRGGGSMTAPNPEAVQRCIRLALDDAGVGPRGRRDQRPPHRDRRRPEGGRVVGRGARRRARAAPADHLDQVDDRPHARRRGRDRVDRAAC
jgi:3-oxoacyl-(acyl-carrier-protein) synthase